MKIGQVFLEVLSRTQSEPIDVREICSKTVERQNIEKKIKTTIDPQHHAKSYVETARAHPVEARQILPHD